MLISILDTRLRILIIYYSITNNQTKRTNQSLEQYLRYYINNIYNNWILLLFIVQLLLNAKISDITKITPFFANYNKEFNLFEKKREYLLIQSVIKKIQTIKKIYNNITAMQKRSIKYQNKKQKIIS